MATLSALVMTFSAFTLRNLICRAISIVVVPESSMMVSPSRIIWEAAWPMRTFSAWCKVSFTVIGTSSGASIRFRAPPWERITAPALGEGVEVAANGDRGDPEAAHQLLHRDPLLRLEELEDAAAALLDQQSRLLHRLRHGSASRFVPGAHRGHLSRNPLTRRGRRRVGHRPAGPRVGLGDLADPQPDEGARLVGRRAGTDRLEGPGQVLAEQGREAPAARPDSRAGARAPPGPRGRASSSGCGR